MIFFTFLDIDFVFYIKYAILFYEYNVVVFKHVPPVNRPNDLATKPCDVVEVFIWFLQVLRTLRKNARGYERIFWMQIFH